MLDKLYFFNGHLTSLALFMLESDELNLDEKQLLLSHIGNCESCMNEYVDSLTEDSLIEPSESLTTRIMEAVYTENEEKKNSNIIAIQFVKLAIAVCLTMVIFFSGALGFSIGSNQRIDNEISYSQQQKPKPNQENKEHRAGLFDNIASNLNRGFSGLADKINIGFKGDAQNGAK